jgi:hypothetical protein
MRILSFSTLFSLCVVASSLSAQAAVDPQTIPPGAKARITRDESKNFIKLTVVGASQDSLRYRLGNDATSRSVDWQRVDRMDVSRGRHSHFFAGLGLGLVAGAALGAIAGSAGASGNDGETPSAMGALGAIMGSISGSVIGAAVGLVVRTESWSPVSIPHDNPGTPRSR